MIFIFQIRCIEAVIFDTPSVRKIVSIGPEWNGRVGTWNQAGWIT